MFDTRSDFYNALSDLQNRFDGMEPELEVTVRDSELEVEGYIVVWNTAISRSGPLPNCAKGGTRIHLGLSQQEVRMLARTMAIKNAAAGLPLGGCKSGLNADPRAPGFEKKYRRFVELCKPFAYENGGPFGGFGYDMGAAPEHALWACDVMGSTRSFTGKPVEMGGTDYDREGIAGLGVSESATQLMTLYNKKPADARFAIHGLGAMGAAVLRYFSEQGAQFNGFGDPKYGGTWCFDNPLSDTLTRSLITQNHDLAQSLLAKEGVKTSNDANAVLFIETDVLFPCAVEYVITTKNMRNIKAKYIVEGANNPTALDAYAGIYDQGIHQIPDFIANAGGIIAAYVELTSSVSIEENNRTRAKVNEAKKVTRSTIRNNTSRMFELSQQLAISLRDAALYIALSTILGQGRIK